VHLTSCGEWGIRQPPKASHTSGAVINLGIIELYVPGDPHVRELRQGEGAAAAGVCQVLLEPSILGISLILLLATHRCGNYSEASELLRQALQQDPFLTSALAEQTIVAAKSGAKSDPGAAAGGADQAEASGPEAAAGAGAGTAGAAGADEAEGATEETSVAASADARAGASGDAGQSLAPSRQDGISSDL